MKHQVMLINLLSASILCGRSSMKCFNHEINKLQYPNMGITNLRLLQCLQLPNKVATKLVSNKVVTTRNFHYGIAAIYIAL